MSFDDIVCLHFDMKQFPPMLPWVKVLPHPNVPMNTISFEDCSTMHMTIQGHKFKPRMIFFFDNQLKQLGAQFGSNKSRHANNTMKWGLEGKMWNFVP